MLKDVVNVAFLQSHSKRLFKIPKNLTLCFCVTFITSMLIIGCKDKPQDGEHSFKVPVNTLSLSSQNIILDFEYPARLASPQSVEVYARVEGILLSQNFKEGDIVKKGQTLFKIDPTRYAARVAIAKAQYDSAKANFAKAQKDWSRVEGLYKEGVLTVDQYDNSLYNYQSAQANVDNTKASLDDARIDLGYTNVVASMTGRVGLRKYDIGNLVGNGTDNVLTTITQLTPIYADFAIPSNDFYYMRNLQRQDVFVELLMSNDKKYDKLGKIDFIDSVLDSQTQSVRVRATFNNDDYKLLPNEFVRVKIKGFSISDGIAIPQDALLQDSQGSYVYVMKDSKAKSVRVNVGRTLKNGEIVILSGLNSGDVLILDNLTKIHEGSDVAAITPPNDEKAKEGSSEDSSSDKLSYSRNIDSKALSHSETLAKDSKTLSHSEALAEESFRTIALKDTQHDRNYKILSYNTKDVSGIRPQHDVDAFAKSQHDVLNHHSLRSEETKGLSHSKSLANESKTLATSMHSKISNFYPSKESKDS